MAPNGTIHPNLSTVSHGKFYECYQNGLPPKVKMIVKVKICRIFEGNSIDDTEFARFTILLYTRSAVTRKQWTFNENSTNTAEATTMHLRMMGEIQMRPLQDPGLLGRRKSKSPEETLKRAAI